jgi:hypothetical protein
MMKRKILIVEDNPQRIEIFKKRFAAHMVTIVGTSVDAVKELRRAVPSYEELHLDNDLGPGCGEGKDVAKAIVKDFYEGLAYPKALKTISVHSMNAPAAEFINSLLSRSMPVSCRVVRRPFNAKELLSES